MLHAKKHSSPSDPSHAVANVLRLELGIKVPPVQPPLVLVASDAAKATVRKTNVNNAIFLLQLKRQCPKEYLAYTTRSMYTMETAKTPRNFQKN